MNSHAVKLERTKKFIEKLGQKTKENFIKYYINFGLLIPGIKYFKNKNDFFFPFGK